MQKNTFEVKDKSDNVTVSQNQQADENCSEVTAEMIELIKQNELEMGGKWINKNNSVMN